MTANSKLAQQTQFRPIEVYLTERDFADRFHVAPRTLQRWRNTGEGPQFVRLGARRVAYRLSDVETWATSRVFTSRADELSRKVNA